MEMRSGEKKSRLALVGPSILSRMQQNGCFDDYEVAGDVISLNPLSLYSRADAKALSSDAKQCELDRTKSFRSYLKALDADYILINLEFVKKPFYSDQQDYFTATSLTLSEITGDFTLYEPTKIGYQIEKYPSELKIILNGIKRFATEVRECFPSERIILMSCISPQFFITANNLVNNNWFIKYNPFLKEVEQAFRKITDCVVWSFPSKVCPLEKRAGQMLNATDYYESLYNEAKKQLPALMDNETEKGNTPDLSFYIGLFKRIRIDVINQKNLRLLIGTSRNATMDFLFDTSTEFVANYVDVFTEFYRKNSSLDEMIRERESIRGDEVYRALKCYAAILKHNYFESDVNYHLMFKYKFRILSRVAFDVQGFCDQNALEVTVTQNNLAYYYAYMQLKHQIDNGQLTQNAAGSLRNMILFSNHKNIIVSPIKLDVWGACISRFIFNADESDFKVKLYLYHVDPIAVMSDIKMNVIAPAKMSWEQSMVFKQIQGVDSFLHSFDNKSDWCIIDNYFITAPNHFLTAEGYIQSADIEFALRTLRLKQEKTAYLDKPFEELIPYLNRYITLLSEKYGQNIIFVKQYYHNYYIDPVGKIQDFSFKKRFWDIDEKDTTFLDRLNALSEKSAEYIINGLNCYVIDLAKHFLPDERSMSELHHLHLEKAFFSESAKLIKMIIRNEPIQREYNDYSPEVKVDRFIRLSGQNGGHPYLKELFNGHWLDSILTRMPLPLIIEKKQELISLYKTRYSSFKECCEAFALRNESFISLLRGYDRKQ